MFIEHAVINETIYYSSDFIDIKFTKKLAKDINSIEIKNSLIKMKKSFCKIDSVKSKFNSCTEQVIIEQVSFNFF